MLKLDILSDIHVDRHRLSDDFLERQGIDPATFDHPVPFDFAKHRNAGTSTLVLAGDVSDHIDDVEDQLIEARKHYEHVVYVDGNHEHKGGGDVEANMDTIAQICNGIPGVHYLDGLDQRRWDHNGVAFIGGNGWYCWKAFEDKGIPFTRAFCKWEDGMHDSRIDFGKFGYPNLIGASQAANLAEEMRVISEDDSIHSVVVVTHTCPDPNLLRWTTDPEYNALTASFTNSELASVLACDLNKKVKLWAYGHTHDRKLTDRGYYALVNNAYGYPKEIVSRAWTSVSFEVM